MFEVYDKRDGKPVDMDSLSQNQNSKGWWGYDLAWYRVHKLSWIVEQDGTLGLCDPNGNVRYPDHDHYYPVFKAKAERTREVLEIVEEMIEGGPAFHNEDSHFMALSHLKTRIQQGGSND